MNYSTAYGRWVGFGPYYAMFPIEFVESVVTRFTKPGQWILDPFAGRGSTVFVGATHGRPSAGIEINPVGWIYGKTKIAPASTKEIKDRLADIAKVAERLPEEAGKELPEFFRYCFSERALNFLITARDNLNWRKSRTDRTLMALILNDLHGTRQRSFSNQMRQSRAMSPDYSVRWWKKRHLKPPQIDPKEFVENKMRWRYAKGIPEVVYNKLFLGDSRTLLSNIAESVRKPFKLLFTSPPYIGISDYHRDQWLRLWMLGNEPAYGRIAEGYRSDFSSAEEYKILLTEVFGRAADMMSKSGYVYVRTDARKQTFEITHDILVSCFPRWRTRIHRRPYQKQTQTALYGDKSLKPGEVDIIIKGPQAN